MSEARQRDEPREYRSQPHAGSASEGLIPKHGGYRKLKSFQIARLVYDITVRFCDRYIDRRSRTHDQMVQAARSGVQNIAEGSQASGTSKKTELKLTSVARASLEELWLDYQDYLRQRSMPQWDKNDPRGTELIDRCCTTADEVALWVWELHERGGRDGQSGRDGPSPKSTPSIPSTYAATAANAALTLIAVANSLLDRQLASLSRAFEQEGGFTERLYRTRQRARRRS
jgi:four helix bundle suffix protein